MGKFFSAKDILEVNDLKVIEVPVPEWGPGLSLRLRQLTANQVKKFTGLKGESQKTAMIVALIFSAIDENGEQIFTNSDIPALEGKSIQVLMRLQKEILKLNGMGKKEVDPETGEEIYGMTVEAASKD